MKCGACQKHYLPPRRFCGGCGAPLTRPCARCGFANESADRFCGGCGDLLDELAERRPRTVALSTPVPVPVPAAANGGPEMLSSKELSDLLKKPSSADPAVLPVRVTQDDLDRLFGAKP
jgi:hypothetical protein